MRFRLGAAAAAAFVISAETVACYTTASTAQTDVLAAVALTKLTGYAAINGGPHPKCTIANAAKRQEW